MHKRIGRLLDLELNMVVTSVQSFAMLLISNGCFHKFNCKIDAGGISLTLKEASDHFGTTVDLSKDMTTGNLLLSFQSGHHFAS